MKIQTATVAEMDEMTEIFSNLLTLHSESCVYDVAKVFFGAQPGDDTGCSPEIQPQFRNSMERLSAMNPDFRTILIEKSDPDRDGIVLYNSPVLERQMEERKDPTLLNRYKSWVKSRRNVWTREEVERGNNVIVYGNDFHTTLGRFFGFPECCIEAYLDHGKFTGEGIVGGEDFIRKSDEFIKSQKTNPLKEFREQPAVMYLEHRPCCNYCAESAEMIKRYKPVFEWVKTIEKSIDRSGI